MAHTLAKQYIMRQRLLKQVTEDIRGMGETAVINDAGDLITFTDGSKLTFDGTNFREIEEKELA